VQFLAIAGLFCGFFAQRVRRCMARCVSDGLTVANKKGALGMQEQQ
jgi:hypothetical protein